jgi:hypothetical protein
MKRMLLGFIATVALGLFAAAPASAAFGLQEVDATFANEDGSLAAQAGSHPDSFTTSFKINAGVNSEGFAVPEGALKNLGIEQMAGLIGSQNSVPQCAPAAFNERKVKGRASCPDDTAVGIAAVQAEFIPKIEPGNELFVHVPVYNLEPLPGEAARLGFVALNEPIVVSVGVNTKPPYNLVATLQNAPQALIIYGSRITLWGNPTNPSHDDLRGGCLGEPVLSTAEPVSLGTCPLPPGTPEVPFLTLPTNCANPLSTLFSATSWAEPNLVVGPISSPARSMSDCGSLGFGPRIDAKPTTAAGESPTGLDFSLDVDDPGLSSPTGRAQSDIRKVEVTLPEGVAVNASAGNGLASCSKAQYEAATVLAAGCPEASKLGSVSVVSPLLKEALPGSLYLAQQDDPATTEPGAENPFDSMIAFYVIIRNEQNGILIKQAGRVEPNPTTGQLVSTFEEVPQLPFSSFDLHFRSGPRAPLSTPLTCGIYPTKALLTPWSGGAPVDASSEFTVSGGPNGGGCVTGTPPFAPSFEAGTVGNGGGTYSPFVLKLARADGDQQLSSIQTTLPQGLLGKLAGISYCPEAGIAQAASRSGVRQGALEISDPSCPLSSEVGTVSVGAGTGPSPFFVTGRAYLAGPYKGAPLSLEIITPAVAGPIDLGVVAVRTALQVDPTSAQITAVSDPIPSILHGIPLAVRSIALDMNRPDFTLNPTSCEPKTILGSVGSTIGMTASLSQYFQASNCGALKFKPKFSLSLSGPTKRAGHPALKAVLTYPKQGAYANIARAQVGLPHSEFLDQGNIGTVCTQPQLKTKTCPKASIYGRAKAWSPLLDQPLEGPVYLGVGYGHKLPDLVADLDGQIRVLLNGKVDRTKQGGLRNTFEAVPDAPVSKFVLELKGGPKKGLLVNSENVCRKPQHVSAAFKAQNGNSVELHPAIKNDCGKKKHHSGKKKHAAKKKHARSR